MSDSFRLGVDVRYDFDDRDEPKLGHFGRVFCALSIVAVSGAIIK